jgi:threonine dehydratase
MQLPTLADVEAAARRIRPYVRRTPVLRSEKLDALTGAEVAIKAECLQRFGAFKARGAFNRIASFSTAERANGVLAYSSGNHAQAVAGAAGVFAIPAVIVMPSDAPKVKVENTKALGGEVVLYDRVKEDREAIGVAIAQERGLALVKPFDDPFIVAGQATVGLEIFEDFGALDVAIAPGSGGGLVTGVATALTALSPGVQVYAAEPVGHEDIVRSFASGQREVNAPGIRSICDALMSDRMGALNWAIAQEKLAGAVAISDEDVKEAMRFAFRELRIVLEPGGAIALAAALTGAVDLKGKRVGIVASGGNVDAAQFAEILSAG